MDLIWKWSRIFVRILQFSHSVIYKTTQMQQIHFEKCKPHRHTNPRQHRQRVDREKKENKLKPEKRRKKEIINRMCLCSSPSNSIETILFQLQPICLNCMHNCVWFDFQINKIEWSWILRSFSFPLSFYRATKTRNICKHLAFMVWDFHCSKFEMLCDKIRIKQTLNCILFSTFDTSSSRVDAVKTLGILCSMWQYAFYVSFTLSFALAFRLSLPLKRRIFST